ncbi:MAG: gliding motility-associated ABC transporter ATP-binding subunit GldA [Marinilabiliales bacterium]|nr:MAG: gliding motility-associated ABC transporter ATP-binding subunit GldA [Marinilabiliales bacterium]
MPVEVKNVVKIYGSQRALDDVTFNIKKGEVLGFLGPNGAGKSTMMRIITGIIPADSGNVSVNGINVMEDSLKVRERIGYLPENNPLYPDMYVREYLQFVTRLYKLPGKSRRVEELIGMTGLGEEQHKKIGALSKGYRQRVGLAQALANDPDVLILDEPTGGLDPNQIVEIRNLIAEAGKEKTVMLSTHIMQEVEAICDRIIIIKNGKIVADDTRENISAMSSIKKISVSVEFDRDVDPDELTRIPGAGKVIKVNGNRWIIESIGDEDIRAGVFGFAVQKNIVVLSMHREERNLESIFRELTG